MSLIIKIILSVCSGILLSLSWPEIGNQTWLIFGAFIPLFFVIFETKNWRSSFLYSFLSFFIWHLLSVWWMWISTPLGSLSAWIINSMLMASILVWAKYSSQKIRWIPFEIILAFYWLSFEIFHLYWDLKWPWMNLGHAFANHTEWIQWYEYSGVYGGSFWVIVLNGLLFRLISNTALSFKKSYLLITFILLLFIPILWSMHLFTKDLSTNSSLKVSIVQPNINTYTEKFDAWPPLKQSEKIIDLIKNADSNSIIILPETAIPESFYYGKKQPKSIDTLLKYADKKHLKIIGGFYTKDSLSSYNAACLVEEGKISQTRHKIKLLAFAEKLPFEFISSFWAKIVHEHGGISESFGTDESASVFSVNDSIQIGTLICFESVFPDIAAEMSQKQAQAFFIITNDDWWLNTPGHRQHFAYARIKAIENRKWVARAANTGISGIINAKGEILIQTNYRETKVLKSEIQLNQSQTFFAKFESEIRKGIILISIFIFIISIFIKPTTISKSK